MNLNPILVQERRIREIISHVVMFSLFFSLIVGSLPNGFIPLSPFILNPNWEHPIGVTVQPASIGTMAIRSTSQAYDTGCRNSSVQSTDAYTQDHIAYINRGTKMQDHPACRATLVILLTPPKVHVIRLFNSY